ncbi:uncharacterized protein LOC110730595 [Chenopodium quinoa]|uniref:uncharacterized protein LOC110730595 n=1 Tax=Chenopodium quinoa TaxID=63459 RepID=UPI000B79320C|nr:uncharacterized protein LOC110730595 [Chenopodium quinoa]
MQEHYNKVGMYLEGLKASDSNTYIRLVMNSTKKELVFQRLFVCFDVGKKGWLAGCRRLLCVDVCFLKTFLGGQLLVAAGRDANDQMYPVAWAVVEGENNDSWAWFMTEVKVCLQLGEGHGLEIILDEHQSILDAVANILPNAEHRHCARHIFAHWHKSFRGDEMKLLFWRAAKSYNMSDYNDALNDMGKLDQEAVVGFRSYNPRVFCRAFMSTETQVDVIMNNLAQTFNGYIINVRTKHLIYMLEDIRTALMQRLALKKIHMEKTSSKVCPRIQVKLEKAKEQAAQCNVTLSVQPGFK